MPPDTARRIRPRLTLRQIGVLVAFSAVAMAVVTPIGRTDPGPWEFALEAATGVPYALLIPTLRLVRRGPIKNWLAAALSAIPLAGLLAYMDWVAVAGLGVLDFSRPAAVTPALLVTGFANAMLLAALGLLARRLIPRTCPDCGRFAMLPRPLGPPIPRLPRVASGPDLPGLRLPVPPCRRRPLGRRRPPLPCPPPLNPTPTTKEDPR